MTDLQVHRVADPAAEAAVRVADLLRSAIAARGRASLAVSGGSSPLPMFDRLAAADLDWSRILVLQVDERVAPDGDPDRNATALQARLLGPAGVPAGNAHLIPVTVGTPEQAAAAYAGVLAAEVGDPPVIDVVHLGLGADGHTASLVPGDAALDVADADVAATGTYQGRRRVTMTRPLLDRARHRIWLVSGADKAAALARLRSGGTDDPAGRIRREGSMVVTSPT